MPEADASRDGDSEPTRFPRNRRVKCNGRTVIRYEHDVREGKELIHRKGDPILDEDYARQYRPCIAWAANGTDYCSAHGGTTPAAINTAKRTIALATPNAAEVLQRIALDERQPASERIKAAVQLLDRGGVRPGVDVSLETPGYMQVLNKLFGRGEEDEAEESEAEEPSTRDDDAADPTGIIRARVRKLTTPPVAPTEPAEETKPARKRAPRKAAPPSGKPKFEGW